MRAPADLCERVLSADADEQMPPPDSNKMLTEAQKQLLKAWVEQGAPYAKHWSLVPPARPSLPEVSHKQWSQGDIDRFVLARLESEGLAPSPEADRPTLLRRLSLDLTGLPPTPAEVDAFLADTSARRLRKGGRSAAGLAALRRADGASSGSMRPAMPTRNGYHIDSERDMWPLARLGDRGVQPQHAVRSVHDRATGRRLAAARPPSSSKWPPDSTATT